ncbi:MAG: DUF222 domain-containing protein, partial [Chloroflexi bacterium]
PAEDRWAARRADALVAISEHVLSGVAGGLVVAGEARQVVVHVDVGVLTGEAPDGLCQLANGAPLSAAAARRIGCDAEIIPVIERDGLPIDVGRKHRSAPQHDPSVRLPSPQLPRRRVSDPAGRRRRQLRDRRWTFDRSAGACAG